MTDGLLKVFGRKERNSSAVAGNSNYLSNHFSDVRSASQARSHAAGTDAARKTFQKQKELEKLLMKAENEDISMLLFNLSTLYSCFLVMSPFWPVVTNVIVTN